MKAPRITDTSLRDGSHPMQHQFTVEQVRAVAQALDEAGIPVIEVTHGDGLAGSSIQYGFSRTSEMELISEARSVCQRAKIAVLLLPGIGTVKELKEAMERGAEIVRIATQCTEADVSEEHFEIAKKLGMETVGFLMMAHMRSPEALVQQARLMESYGADCVYIVDSAGAMLPHDAYARVKALKEALSIQVGFHAHNNLGVAVGNSLAALEAGADQLDGCLRGLGAGAGNAPTELLATVLEKMGLNPGLDVYKLMDAAEYVIAPMMPYQPIPSREAITIGYAGVYSTFLLHAQRAGERYGIDPRTILTELGRRQAVAGQEDWILDVALELARDSQVHPPLRREAVDATMEDAVVEFNQLR
jgi:4-hydroxy 2-oxovalerate aldolase